MVPEHEKTGVKAGGISLFTGPIRSGKTTALLNWIADKKQVGGFLTPDLNGRRVLYDIGSRTAIPFEVDGTVGRRRDYIRIGRFNFYRSAFSRGADIVTAALRQPLDLLIIDEIGRLELKNSGFAGIIKKVVRAHRAHEFRGALLFVVRDSLLKKVTAHFDIQPYRVIGLDDMPGRPQ